MDAKLYSCEFYSIVCCFMSIFDMMCHFKFSDDLYMYSLVFMNNSSNKNLAKNNQFTVI